VSSFSLTRGGEQKIGGLGNDCLERVAQAYDLLHVSLCQRVLTKARCHEPIMFIVPIQMLSTWKADLNKYLEAEYITYRPTKPMTPKQLLSHGVILATYDKIRQEYSRYKEIAAVSHKKTNGDYEGPLLVWDSYPTMLICCAVIFADEIGKASRFRSETSKAMCALQANKRVGLTGTPLENDYDEIQTIMKWLGIKPGDEPNVCNDCFVSKKPKKTKARTCRTKTTDISCMR
jgi:hypothetical protein